MKISKLSIRNFKTIKKIDINFKQDISLIVGKNNIGKSNVLKALDLFFKNLNTPNSNEAICDTEDFRKNTVSLRIDVTFSGIKKQIEKIRKETFDESKKKRSNQKSIKQFEQQINVLELFCSRKDEISISLEIKREGNKSITPAPSSPTSLEKFKDKTINAQFVQMLLPQKEDKQLQNLIRSYQSQNTKKWFSYDWLEKEETSFGGNEYKYSLKLDDEKEYSGIFKIDEKSLKTELNQINSSLISFINERQRFLYIPAYRGGEKERNDAIEKLFDLVIEDLVSGKGVSKEYDTVTDAIWGTGKNNNQYNLNKVVSERLDKLIDSIKYESISTINEIKFKALARNEIRSSILKIMLGTSNIILDDGVETSYESKGTGIQSSFMISLLKSLSQLQFSKSLNIILVIEEPEAFTHPQLTREIMDKMCRQDGDNFFQFIVTTHSPVIVNLVDGSKIQRLAEKHSSSIKETINCTSGKNLTNNEWNLINRICDVNISEIVFADFVVFVEGEGDAAIFNKLLKKCLPQLFNRISVISISGNNQIFKLQKLLKYYDISWILIADKDSFIDKRIEDKELTNQNLADFFKTYQVGQEFQSQYSSVLNHPAVEKIVITSQNVGNLGFGSLLKKANEINPSITDIKRQELFGIISDKVVNDFIPTTEAIDIIDKFNKMLNNNDVHFYSLPGDLESFVVNDATYKYACEVFEENFPEPFHSFIESVQNFSKDERIRELQKRLGSKRFNLSKVPNSAKDRKKPHIPIEIISKYLDNEKVDENKILTDFREINYLIDLIKKHLKPSR